jgi:hypothetical protein
LRIIYLKVDNCWGGKMSFRRRTFFIFLMAVLLVLPVSLSAMVQVDGFIHNDTTWTDADTILIPNLVIVDSTATLIVQPGTVVMFGYNASMWVWGKMYAEGNMADSILFTSVVEAYGGTPSAGSWTGLDFYSNSFGSMKYCHFRYAINGILTSTASVELYDCLSENFSNGGFYIDGGTDSLETITVERCTARQEDSSLIGTGTGIFVYQSVALTISQSRFYDCEVGIDLSANGTAHPEFEIADSDIRDNLLYGIYIHTCTCGSIGAPQGSVHGSNILNNGNMALKVISMSDSLSVIYATDNYWGVTDSAAIAALIYDHADTAAVPTVEYIPFALDSFDISGNSPTGIGSEDNKILPSGFSLEQNYPNPFNPNTTIQFTLPHRANVELTVYNVLGQQVKTLENKSLPAGVNTVEWDGRDESGNIVSSGIYLYRLRADSFVATKKMALVK